MKQEIEIEFKNLLTKEEFQQVIAHFHLADEAFFFQKNYYIDTPSMTLKSMKSALRIREKNNQFTLTLKQPLETGLLESHQPLTSEEAMNIINGTSPIHGEMTDILHHFNLDISTLHVFGSLSTNRAEIPYQNGILVLDHSRYFNCEDFELEYEVTDEETGKLAFHKLLQELHIPLRKTENKIKRFYLEKQKQSLS